MANWHNLFLKWLVYIDLYVCVYIGNQEVLRTIVIDEIIHNGNIRKA
jgi:hypothetical protein